MVAELSPAEEEALLARIGIPITLGGIAKRVPPLTMDRARVWRQLLAERVGLAIGAIVASPDDWASLVAALAGASDQHVDLLLAYDERAALGGREWIESHGTPREIYEALKAVLAEAFPFEAELLRKVPPAALIPTVLQVLRSSTSSPSPPSPAPIAMPRSSRRSTRRGSSGS
jgi:hypothetical protein